MNENRILFQDDYLVAVQKLAGEICESAPGAKVDSKYFLPDIFSSSLGEGLKCPHRIDRPVTGVAIMTRTDSAARRMSTIFSDSNKVKKTYWAIVEGIVEPTAELQKLSGYIKFLPSKQKAVLFESQERKSKKAELLWRSIGHGDRYSFLEVFPLTGRTHQIRVQLAKAGMSIKGDVKYGARRSDTLEGIRLHAAQIIFPHPKTAKEMVVRSDVPVIDPLWSAFLDCLKING